jgi:alanyl-tRNA synthetase
MMMYNKSEDGTYTPLKQNSIDTGMGVERTAAMLQGVPSVFDTEAFIPLIGKIKELSSMEEFSEEEDTQIRIIADHVRSAIMIMADDRQIDPSNVEQGYIVRRLLRKAIHSADRLNIGTGFMIEITDIVVDMFKDVYKEVERNQEFIVKNLKAEEEKFRKTLTKALRRFDRIFQESNTITGQDAFLLFTSFGLPLEMTRDLAEERGIAIDMEQFTKQFEEHREKSRTATQGKFKGGLADHSEEITKLHTATHLLQTALRKVLGNEVTQNGSNITDERLRFDFTFSRKLTPDEVEQVEKMINDVIAQDIAVEQSFMKYDDAIAKGALAFFKENYGEEVSVYNIGEFSLELCGGPHVESTAVLGKFRIAKQKKIGAGIVRIRAVLESNS